MPFSIHYNGKEYLPYRCQYITDGDYIVYEFKVKKGLLNFRCTTDVKIRPHDGYFDLVTYKEAFGPNLGNLRFDQTLREILYKAVEQIEQKMSP